MLKKFSLNSARRKAAAMVAAVVAVGVAVTGAILYPGFATADVDLNDGGVWVTNQSTGQVGHINYSSRTLDAGLLATSSEFDLTQESSTVFMSNGDDGSQAPIDVANVTLGQPAGLPARAQLLLGTEHAVVVDSLRGKIWAMGAAGVASFAAADQDPLLQDLKGVIAAIGRDDTIHVADPRGEQLLTYAPQPDGTYRETTKERLAGLSQTEAPQITALGSDAVVLDPDEGRLYLPGGRTVDLPEAKDAVLQQSGGSAKAVAMARSDAVIKVPLDGGDAVRVDAGGAGAPAAPVQLDGCIHAAWAGSGQYLRDCDDDAGDRQTAVPSLEAQAELQFRVNRRVVVLNDLSGGNVWLVNDGMQIINNWEDLKPPPGDDDKKSDEQSNEISPVTELPDRTKENTPPVAVNDDFGVRAGRTTVLPIIYNDSDSDGDLLTAEVDGAQPDIGAVQGIYDGTGLQIVVPPDASGTASFRYTVNDGRGGEDTASVRLRVVAAESNQPPVQERETVISMEQGRSINHNVLTDWSDPDGDDLQLTAARVASGQDLVRIRPDGLLTFQDVGVSTGRKEVSVTVSDGRDRTTARLVFDVKPRGVLKPAANPDHVMVAAGEDIAIAPLKNDQDPAGGTLRLAQAQEIPGATVRPNIEAGTINFRSERPGTYYVTYLVTNGPASAVSLIRVDVVDGDAENGAPVAVRDTALLPAGGEALVDVLANDSDPSGGVLVVQSVSAPRDTAVTLSVVNHSVVRVSDTRGLAEPTSFTYVVSNGTESSTGEVSVVPVPAPPKLQPPKANPDEATVRANDVVNIPVLANDEHPNGASLALNPTLVETVNPDEGLVSVSGDQLRFKAGAKARTVSVVYSVVGPDGQEASAQVTIHVRPLDGAKNANPVPRNVTGRVLTGETTRIVIPLDGIDPDGDSVTLIGLDRTPAKGTARVGAAAIEYTAASGSLGTDVFSYVVEDRLGARATGTVSVGIAPTAEANHPPVAVDDQISVRPGRKIAVDVLANDTDADGDSIRFAGAPGTDAEIPVSLTEGRITLTAPDKAGVVVVRYPITDGRGGTDSGNLSVDVRPDARLLPPLARDDRVAVAETVGRTEVEVPILDNDEDPDGVVSELKIALPERIDGVSVTGGRDLRVPLAAEAQVIPYTLTDIDGQKSTAFVLVPGSMEERPSLRSSAPLEVMSGERLTLDLAKLVKVRSGRTPRITQDDKVRGVSGTASVIDAARLAFVSERDFSGAASVSFEVTDGSGPDDPKGLKATLTVGINVTPKPDQNRPPVFRSNTLEAAQGEDAAALDLRQAASDPDPADAEKLRFALTGGSLPGVKVSLDGSVLKAEADADTRSGSRGVFDVTVTDGRSAPVKSTVTVMVVSTKRPLAVANTDTVLEAHSGRAESVKVLANDTNPFPDSPLRLMTAQVRVGQGTASVSGDTVTVTPAGDFVGTMEVRYRVQDKTRDPSREVDGRILLTVKGRPDAPVTPVIQEVRDRTVVLTWEPPANNGSPITGYTVSGTGGFRQSCPAATCTLLGLTNNKEYTFSVVARNAVGTSEPSPESAVARPDVKPETPAAPQLTFGDSALTVAWTKPASKGSPVKSYNLEISPAPSSGIARKEGITASPYTWTGLTNGVAYQVRVQAVNDATEPSDWSLFSAAEVPAGVPDAALAPTAVRNESAANGGVIDVSWTAPNSNGAPIQSYDLQVFRNGVAEPTRANLPASPTSAQLTGLDTASNYTFAVVARNKAGASQPSARSAAVTPYGQPLAPAKPRAVATGNNNQIALLFDEPGNNGSPITGYQVSIDGGGWNSFGGPGANVNVGNNGAPAHTFRVRALNAAGAGPESPVSNQETAYGPIANAANIRKSSDGINASFTWNPKESDYANGRPVTSMRVSVNGNGVANNGSWSGGNSPDTTFTLRIEVCRADGCRTFSDSVQTASRQADMSQGPKKVGDDCFTNECWYFGVTLRNFMPNRNVDVDCFYTRLDGTAYRFAGFTATTNGNGYWYSGDRCYLGHKNSINSANKWTGPYWFRATEGGTGRVVDSNKNVSW